MEKLHKTTPDNLSELLSNTYIHFIEDLKFAVRLRFDVWEAVFTIEEVANALRTGASCVLFQAYFKNDLREDSTGINRMTRHLETFGAGGGALYGAFSYYSSLDWGGRTEIVLDAHTMVRRCEAKGVQTYSPFATIAPLKSLPLKWTVPLVIRALWNGQFADLQCDYFLTDDYARDNADNFSKGEIRNARAFAKQLIESPRGWWASGNKEGTCVSICCHSFDSNHFRPVLVPAEAPVSEPALA